MKEQITKLEDRHRRNNLRFMGIMEKSGVEKETWEERETKLEVFLQENLGLETDEISIEGTHWISKKEGETKMDHHRKIFKLQAA